MARAGAGLAMLPDILADGLERSPSHEKYLEVGVWVGAHPDLSETPRIALCRRWFGDALAKDPRLSVANLSGEPTSKGRNASASRAPRST